MTAEPRTSHGPWLGPATPAATHRVPQGRPVTPYRMAFGRTFAVSSALVCASAAVAGLSAL